jgi:peptidoglycan LD-endopeptidase LytH
MKRRLGLLPTLLLALLAALAAGCSGVGGRQTASGTSAPPPASAAPTTSAARTTTAAPTTAVPTTAVPTTAAPVRYRYPVAGCRASYGQHSGYPAADMFTGRGCAFVAPVAGRVDEVTRVDRWRQASDRRAVRGRRRSGRALGGRRGSRHRPRRWRGG